MARVDVGEGRVILALTGEVYEALKKELTESRNLAEEALYEYVGGDVENGPRSPSKEMIDEFKMLETILKELE